jgi:peptidoglycan/xylan/chitin deacetylase (PgdA/CDA1 family)
MTADGPGGSFGDDARAAVSITFDDARPSQLDHGLPVLDANGIRATFYVLPRHVAPRRDAWRAVAAAGHEIGNHSMTHPCSGNHRSSQANPLEDLTVDALAADIARADDELHALLGVTARTYAYPCGQTTVGRGEQKASYVPVVARRFLAGRGYRGETANDPDACDLALLDAFHGDALTLDAMLATVDGAVEDERWAIFAFHEVRPAGEPDPWAVTTDVLAGLCARLRADRRVRVAPVADVATLLTERSTRAVRSR